MGTRMQDQGQAVLDALCEGQVQAVIALFESGWIKGYDKTTNRHDIRRMLIEVIRMDAGEVDYWLDHCLGQTEPVERIRQRIEAAAKWRYWHNTECDGPPTNLRAAEKAVKVMVMEEKTSDYLAEHDPQALKQAQLTLSMKSWEDFMPKKV